MKLIYHPASPFVRKVYMLALELGLASQITLEKVVVAPIPYPGWSDNNEDVSAAGNPLAKIPTLVVDDLGEPFALFDSKVICEFLLDRAGSSDEKGVDPRTRWMEKAVHACADGMADAEVLVVYEERIRGERGLKFDTWIEGQREKIRRGFDFLERMTEQGVLKAAEAGSVPSLAEIAASAAITIFDDRNVEWRNRRPALTKWFEITKRRDSFVKTQGRGW